MDARVEKVLKEIGVTINGDKPYDIIIHNPRVFSKIITKQSMGAGESYMDGWWDCEKLDEFFFRLCRSHLYNQFYSYTSLGLITCKNAIINQQTRKKSEEVAKLHYDLSNKMYEYMLGKSMAYTCGYWKESNNLDDAQFAKYDLICRKLRLENKDTVLEIGCGRGGLAKYMAEKYGCRVIAFDISKEASSYASQLCEGLPVTIYQADYRDVDIYHPNQMLFDKIVSVGVLEHIGYKNYEMFLDISLSLIKKNGIFLLHSIGCDDTKNYCDPWINKYIFPNGMLPSLLQLSRAFEKRFVVEDFHNFGAYYDKTLMAWYENLNHHWDDLSSEFDERFHRMMNYYLLACAGSFRARNMHLWQFVLTPEGMIHGYNSIR